MSFQNIQHGDGLSGSSKLSFECLHIDLAIVNALRRIIMSDVPSMSMFFAPFDQTRNGVNIIKNTSALHNEMIGQRISLVPVHIDEVAMQEFIDQGNSSKYTIKLSVKNTTDRTILVTSKDLKVYVDNATTPDTAITNAFFPPCPITKDHIVLVKLRPGAHANSDGEEIVLEATPSIGTGSTHACYCPVSVCYFTNAVDIDAGNAAFADKLAAVTKHRIAEGMAPPSDDEIAQLRAKFDALEAKRFFFKNSAGEPCHFEFHIESECRLKPAFIVMKALMVMRERVVNIKDAIENGNHTIAKINPYGNTEGLYQVVINHEGHTMGNLLQSLIFNKEFVAEATKTSKHLEFVGYHKPHPLEDYVLLQIKIATGIAPETLMTDCLQWAQQLIGAIACSWYDAAGLKDMKLDELYTFVTSNDFSSGKNALASLASTLSPAHSIKKKDTVIQEVVDTAILANDAPTTTMTTTTSKTSKASNKTARSSGEKSSGEKSSGEKSSEKKTKEKK